MRQPKPAPLEEAARQWRAGAYWEVHETLEPHWRAARGEERLFLHGLILAAAALEAARRGHARGAVKNLEKARRKWRSLKGAYRGWRLDDFLDGVAAALEGDDPPEWPFTRR